MKAQLEKILGNIWRDLRDTALTLVGRGPTGLVVPTAVGVHAPSVFPMRECPHCREAVRVDANVCPHCRRESEPLAQKTSDERKRILETAIQSQAVIGGRLQSHQDFQAVLVFGKPVNHTLHLLLSVFTCGFWLFVWPFVGIAGGEKRVMLTVDDYGNVGRYGIGS